MKGSHQTPLDRPSLTERVSPDKVAGTEAFGLWPCRVPAIGVIHMRSQAALRDGAAQLGSLISARQADVRDSTILSTKSAVISPRLAIPTGGQERPLVRPP